MIDVNFEFECSLQAWCGIAESLHAAGVDSAVPWHNDGIDAKADGDAGCGGQ